MVSNEINILRQKLVDAERKYYSNLNVLEEKLARLEAIQSLSEVLIACIDDAEVLSKLVETTIRSMGVEKAVVLLSSDNGYRSVAVQGYSRKQVKLLHKRFFAAQNKEISAIVVSGKIKLYQKR